MNKSINGLSIIIPAYNEEGAIEMVISSTKSALDKIADLKYEIIVVDDASTDNTFKIVRALSAASLIRHPKNLGYGKSIITGISNAKYDVVGIIDADNTYEANDFQKMIPLMEVFDMVVGVRDMKNIKQSLLVKILRLFLKTMVMYFSENSSPDPNSGLRVFKKEIVLKGKDLFSLKFSFSTSLTFFAHLTNLFVEYIPIKYHSRIGYSKVHHVRDSLRVLILIISMALIYKPLKCFFLHAAISVMGLLVLFSFQSMLDFKTLLMIGVAWIVLMLFFALGYVSFILSQIYGISQGKK